MVQASFSFPALKPVWRIHFTLKPLQGALCVQVKTLGGAWGFLGFAKALGEALAIHRHAAVTLWPENRLCF